MTSLLVIGLYPYYLSHDIRIRKEMDRTGCNIGPKTLLAEWGKLPLKFTHPASQHFLFSPFLHM